MSDQWAYCYVVPSDAAMVEMPLIECGREPGHDGPHSAAIQVTWENSDD
jgi:hypothetical protein